MRVAQRKSDIGREEKGVKGVEWEKGIGDIKPVY